MVRHPEWKVLRSKEVFKTKYFALKTEVCELGDGRTHPGYYVVDFPDWVHVVALTPQGELELRKIRDIRERLWAGLPEATP